MPRVFRHYIPIRLILLVAAEALVIFGSTYVHRLLPLVGLPEIVPFWGSTRAAAIVLTLLVLPMIHLAGLYDSQGWYERGALFLRLFFAFTAAYLGMATLGFLFHSLALSRVVFVVSFAVSFTATFALRLAEERFSKESLHRGKVLLLGSGRVSRLIADTIAECRANYEVLGYVNGHPDGGGDEDEHGMRVLGSVSDLGWIIKLMQPDLLVVAMEERRGALPLPAILDCKLQGMESDHRLEFYGADRTTGARRFDGSSGDIWRTRRDGGGTTRRAIEEATEPTAH